MLKGVGGIEVVQVESVRAVAVAVEKFADRERIFRGRFDDTFIDAESLFEGIRKLGSGDTLSGSRKVVMIG